MKLTKLLLLCFLSFVIYSCSDDNESDNPTETPNLEAEKQINKVIDVLEEDEELSTFKDALSKIDAKKFEDKEFTILAYKNQSTPKTKSSKNDSIQNQETLRHIIGGHHTFEALSKLKKVIALSKDTLHIEYSDSTQSITINGVLLGKSVTADKSIVFVVDSIIPQAQDTIQHKEQEYVFKVANINPFWSPSNPSESVGFAENALVSIYENDEVIKELKTDINGEARFTYKDGVELDYIVKTDTSSMFYNGYQIAGLFTSQVQIDAAPVQLEFKAVLGSLKFVDTNGDGIINEDDKMDRDNLANITNETIIYLVGKSYIYPKEEQEIVTIDMAYDAYDDAEELFTKLDSLYSTLDSRKVLSPTSKVAEDMWNKGYDAIRKINVVLDNNTIDADDRLELEEFRADLHLDLSIIYGDVPVQLNKELINLPRNARADIYDFAQQTYNGILNTRSDSTIYKSDVYIKKILVSRLQNNFTEVYNLAQQAFASGRIALSADGTSSELNIVRIYLLAAEAANELQRTTEALQYINTLLHAEGLSPLPPSSTIMEIRTAIRNFYKSKRYEGVACDHRIKYNNIISWSLDSNWGKHKLFPIPEAAISESNGILSQNSGY